MIERTDVGTVDDLHESATRLVGLDDFGPDDDNYREGLAVILDSYRRDADLTPFGSKMCRVYLRGALAARLMAQAGWKQPGWSAPAPPRFIACSPRTRCIRDCRCGWRSFRSRARPGRLGPPTPSSLR
jgi:hypothetical protein